MRHDQSLKKPLGALDPDSIQIDERNVLDRLSFAAIYADLIHFYDKNNQKNGTWRPFLLKDPIILLAAISQTDYASKHLLFLMLNQRLSNTDTTNPQYGSVLEQTFNLIQSIFTDIDDWLVQMDNDAKPYALKTFVEQQVSTDITLLLWQFLTLRTLAAQRYADVNAADYKKIEKFHTLWRTQLNKAYKDIPTDCDIYSKLQPLYYALFSFYVQVIDNAGEIFEDLKKNFQAAPDTALLIAFVQLMEVQQKQLNQLTKRHLDFYYQDILKQTYKPAQADSAYLSIVVKPNAQEFLLPANTAFNAGQDIIYQSTQAYLLNKAKLKQTKTLCYSDNKLYLNKIDAPSKLKKDAQDQVLNWALLGEKTGEILKQGFAFASPMFNLDNGERIIRIAFQWQDESLVKPHYFKNSETYFSTEEGWFKVSVFEFKKTDTTWLKIRLDAGQAAIRPLKKNPDGYNSAWAIFKLILGDDINLTQPPILKTITIKTKVKNYTALELYNDLGKIADSKGGLPFGALPKQGSSFYLGSAELFAKPLTELNINIHWNNIPPLMQDYYQTYNEFLTTNQLSKQIKDLLKFITLLADNQKKYLVKLLMGFLKAKLEKEKITVENLKDCHDTLLTVIPKQYPENLLQGLLKDIADLCTKAKTENPLAKFHINNDTEKFNNQCFKISFSLYQQAGAAETQTPALISLFNEEKPKPAPQPQSRNTVLLRPKPVKKPVRYGLLSFLFGKKPVNTVTVPPAPLPLSSKSSFEIQQDDLNNINPIPNLLTQPLVYNAANKTGFLNLRLEQPSFAFGHDLYAQVILDISQQNAAKLLKKNDNYVAIPPPNQPYTPKITKLFVNYSAEQQVDFSETNDYPFEFYHYDSFNTYSAFNEKLFAGLTANAFLYLNLVDLEPPCQLSLYIELCQFVALEMGDIPPELQFYYLTKTGWKVLPVLADETDNLSASGLIEFNIPEDIGENPTLMSESGYWLAFSTANQADDFARVMLLTTQGIKVQRINPKDTPYLEAKKIKSLIRAIPEIDSIAQPFATFNGVAAEQQSEFYHRVSQRIKTKDRVSCKSDFELMALKALQGLYYSKLIPANNAGEVLLGLVNGYDNPSFPDAFNPVVTRRDLNKIHQYLSARISPFVKLSVFNLSHEIITVTAELKFAPTVPINRTCRDISQQLKLYLSPWIESEQKQITIDSGISSSALNDFLMSFSGVESVNSLSVKTSEQQVFNQQFIAYPKHNNGLFISAEIHDIHSITMVQS